MKSVVALIVTLLILCNGYSQKKELTLETAVLQQYRSLRPDGLNMYMWIPQTDAFSYVSANYQVLYKASVKETKPIDSLSIQDVNNVLGSELYNFYSLKWKSECEFWLNDGTSYYLFDWKTKKGNKLYSLSGDAGDQLFHEKTEMTAFIIGNNISVISKNGTIKEVTNNIDKNIVSGQAIARSEFGISGGLFWSPNGDYLAFYQKDETDVHDYPLLDITKTPGELNSIKYPMAGQKSEKPKVGIYNCNTGRTTFVSPRNTIDAYLTNLAFTPDNKYVVIAEVNRDQNHMWLNVYSTEAGEFIRTLFEETNDKWVEPEHAAFFPDSESNNFIWISERDGFNNLYYYDINGILIKKLTDHKFVVKDIVDYKTGRLYYSTTGENPLQTHVYWVDLNGKQGILTRADGTHHIDISSNGKYFHDSFSAHDVASKDWIIDGKGKIVKILLESRDKLIDYKVGQAEIGKLTANDGSTLYTRMIKPSNFDPTKKYPVLVYVYGGPHAQLITDSWLDGASLWMYWMAEQGYIIYTVDGRGSAERGFSFESQIHRQLGLVEMEDQLKGVEYLKSLPYVDGNRLAVHGWSFGGFMTTSLMLRHPDVFNVGVAGGPVTDWKYYEIMYGERYMDRPEDNEKGYEQSSLFTYAGNLKGDLLLIHGTVDDVVVMQHNYALVKKFVELGIQMDFFPYPMHKHNVYGKDRVHLMQKVLNYVIENN